MTLTTLPLGRILGEQTGLSKYQGGNHPTPSPSPVNPHLEWNSVSGGNFSHDLQGIPLLNFKDSTMCLCCVRCRRICAIDGSCCAVARSFVGATIDRSRCEINRHKLGRRNLLTDRRTATWSQSTDSAVYRSAPTITLSSSRRQTQNVTSWMMVTCAHVLLRLIITTIIPIPATIVLSSWLSHYVEFTRFIRWMQT